MDTTPPEDVFVVPPAWHRHIHPRQGAPVGYRADPGWPDAVARLLADDALVRKSPGSTRPVARIEPGLVHHDPTAVPEQTVAAVWGTDLDGADHVRLGDLDPVVASEIIRDDEETAP
ncbi:hypothetical protein ACFFX1_01630 [Dactylosporangium sucinum]|uniref:Uncharacterized protein n=1 Tax=Dactylosporangium sucinum TaxID=1424081 RepID=A0A917WJ42_9ACTN|nr:hypothetical protein [Dactylosporangium sucinum]GGM08888.1 hypothetical protein GCM10007977_007530 [Dactylosporangium sucinum]